MREASEDEYFVVFFELPNSQFAKRDTVNAYNVGEARALFLNKYPQATIVTIRRVKND